MNLNETHTHEHKTQSNNVHKGKKKTVPNSTHNSIMCSLQECVEQNVNKGVMKKNSVRTYSDVCNKCAQDNKSWIKEKEKDTMITKDIELQRKK